MKKIYQTIIDKDKGNCMQAVVASLFEKELNEVPNFMEYDKWFEEMMIYFQEQGYKLSGYLHNEKYQSIIQPTLNCFQIDHFDPSEMMSFETLSKYTGVNGFFFASVLSPKNANGSNLNQYTHAVVIDSAFNIVHDPNKEYEKIYQYPLVNFIEFNGIIDVFKITKV